VERRSSFSIEQDAEWPSEGEMPAEEPESGHQDTTSPDLGAVEELTETQQPSIPQVDGSDDHPRESQESADYQMADEIQEDTFGDEEAVLQETPAASFRENVIANASISTPDRADISTLIKEAGFRQTIDSEVAWPREEELSLIRAGEDPANSSSPAVAMEKTAVGQTSIDVDKDQSNADVASPKFNGFGSPPPAISNHGRSPRETTTSTDTGSQEMTAKGKNKFKGFDTPGYPKLRQSPDKVQPEIQDGDSVISQDFDATPVLGDDSEIVEDSIVVSSDMQNGQRVNGPRLEISEDDSLLKPISLSKENSSTSHKSLRLDGAADDDDLQPLDRIISSTAPARSSEISPPATRRGQKKTSISPEKHDITEVRNWPLSSPPRSDSTPPKTGSKPAKRKLFTSQHATGASSQSRSFLPSFDRDSPPPLPPVSKSQSSSQIPEGSQIVDLTQVSSDPISNHSSDDGFTSSFRGSGWVKETRSQSSQDDRNGNGRKRVEKIRRSMV